MSALEHVIPEGYKQTEVGLIPNDWFVKTFGQVMSIRHGKDQKAVQVPDGCYPIFGTGGKMGTTNTALYDKPSVLIGRKGTINKPRYIDKPFWTVDTLFYSVVSNSESAKFIYYKFCMIDWMQYNEASGVPSLNASTIESVSASFPELKEQTAIANALSDVDALISELEKLIAKKQAIKTATMQQLLTGRTRLPQFALRDNGTPKGTKPSELGEIPEDWEVYGLGQLIKGTQLGGNYKNSEQETGQPLIKMGNLGRGYIKLDKLEFVLGKVKDVDRLEFGDLLFNTRNTLDLVGKVSVWRNELPVAFFNSNLMRITFDPALIGSNFYMNAVMNSDGFVNALSDIAIGTTSVAAIYSRDLFKLKVSLPSKQEQTAIATILSDMDAEIQALEQRLGKTRQIKQGMMQELLTGKTRLIQGEAHD